MSYYSSTQGGRWARFSGASAGWFSEGQRAVGTPVDDFADFELQPAEIRPRVSWFRRALLSTFVVLVVAAAVAFIVYALAHDRGPHADLARSALRAVGVPEPPSTRPQALTEPSPIGNVVAPPALIGSSPVVRIELGLAAPELADPNPTDAEAVEPPVAEPEAEIAEPYVSPEPSPEPAPEAPLEPQ